MRLHLKNISPEIHGLIAEHKASHGHKNLDDTVSCLIKTSMTMTDARDEREDQDKIIKFHLAELAKLTDENEFLKEKYKQLKEAVTPLSGF